MCRAVLLLVPKTADGRIAYNSREKEDSLSLKKINLKLLDIFSFFSSTFSFPLFYSFLFAFLYFPFLILFSHHLFFSFFFFFSLSFSPHFLLSLCISLIPLSIDRMGQKEEVFSPPSSSQMCGYPISIHFLLFHNSLFITSSLSWLNVSHGIMPPCGSM